MFHLFFSACSLFARHVVRSAAYAAPALFFLTCATTAFINQKDYAQTAGFFVLFILANTLYIHAAARQVQKSDPTVSYRDNMRWHNRHSELLIFIISGSMLSAALTFYVSDFIFTLRAIAEEIERDMEQHGSDPFSVLAGLPHLIIVGSRLLSFLLLLFSMWLWNFFCRIGIRIPALTNGFYLRTGEAMELTAHDNFTVTTVSLFFIVSVSTLTGTIIGKIPSPPPAWTVAFMYTAAYFVLAQLHIGLWVALYEKATVNYRMNRLQ